MISSSFNTLEEAFAYCRDMDASLGERLQLFADVSRRLRPEAQEAVDRMVDRLKASEAGAGAPLPGQPMPSFTLPDETGHLVSLEDLLETGPVAITFHRGHWCPYCRINTRALAEVQEQIFAEGASIVDFFGRWPYYLIPLTGVAVVTCLLAYLPFAIHRKLTR